MDRGTEVQMKLEKISICYLLDDLDPSSEEGKRKLVEKEWFKTLVHKDVPFFVILKNPLNMKTYLEMCSEQNKNVIFLDESMVISEFVEDEIAQNMETHDLLYKDDFSTMILSTSLVDYLIENDFYLFDIINTLKDRFKVDKLI